MGMLKTGKILFVTDLHGNISKYRRVFAAAIKHGVAAVVNGGDMLTLGGDLHGSQRDFIEEFLSPYFSGYEKAGICHLGFLGNDDLKIHDGVFDETCRKYKHVINLAQRRFELNDFEFIGMNRVADYPFRLKDRCRRQDNLCDTYAALQAWAGCDKFWSEGGVTGRQPVYRENAAAFNPARPHP